MHRTLVPNNFFRHHGGAMRDPLPRVPIKYKLTASFAGICLIAFGVGGYLISNSARDTLENEISIRLKLQTLTIAELMDSYLEQLARRTEDFASDGFIRSRIAEIAAANRPASHEVRLLRVAELRDHLVRNKFPLVHDLLDITLYDTTRQRIVDVKEHASGTNDAILLPGMRRDTIWFSAMIADEVQRAGPALAVMTPVYDIHKTIRLGSLVFWIDVRKWIEHAIRSYSQEIHQPLEGSNQMRLFDTAGDGILVRWRTDSSSSGSFPISISPERKSRPGREQDSGNRSWIGHREYIGFTHEIPHNNWRVHIEIDAEKALSPVSGLQSLFLGSGIIFALAAMVLLFFPMRFLIKPLAAMRDAARRMSDGDYSVRVDAETDDEIGDLARSFNSMASATEERNRQLQHSATLLERRGRELQLERDLLNTVVHSMQDGLIYVDTHGNIVLHNDAAAPLAQRMKAGSHGITAMDCDCADARSKKKDCLQCLLCPGIGNGDSSCIIDAGESVYEILATSLDNDGESHGRILVSRDITTRMRIDERQAHQERLAMLGEVAAIMAHELNNPLAAISMFNQMMGSDFPSDSPYREHIDVIRRNTDICKRTIRDLLDYSRSATPALGDFDLHELLTEVMRFLKPLYEKSNLMFELRTGNVAGLIHGDELYLRQVFVNLLLNAVQAMDAHGGGVVVETSDDEASDQVCIDITDSGPGIPVALQQKIFEPFFTSKRAGEGTGLGLSTSRRIVESFGGQLGLYHSEPGSTTFRVQLPRRMSVQSWETINGSLQEQSSGGG